MIRGQRVLVTGATGLVGHPLALALAAENEVVAVARFTRAERSRARLEAAGVRIVAHDLSEPSLAGVPSDVDYVFHTAALVPDAIDSDDDAYQLNAQAPGRLLAHCRRSRGFVHCSTSSVYELQGLRATRESDRYGAHYGTYSLTKIAAEMVLAFASREWRVPTVIARLFTMYSPRGGALTHHLRAVAAGQEIALQAGGPPRFNPMYESDYVEKLILAATLGQMPPLVVNLAGSDDSLSAQECLAYAGELLGTPPLLREREDGYRPVWGDVARMHELMGPCRVDVREGIRRVLEGRGYLPPRA